MTIKVDLTGQYPERPERPNETDYTRLERELRQAQAKLRTCVTLRGIDFQARRILQLCAQLRQLDRELEAAHE